jgi:anaerobic dimethyl sulfoxide reductase subunit A
LERQTVWINPRDAAARGIKEGDEVRVFNDIGTLRIPAKVTERIMPGVIRIDEGAWYDPDERGIDRAGSVNVLCKDIVSPGGAAATNAILVQLEKV